MVKFYISCCLSHTRAVRSLGMSNFVTCLWTKILPSMQAFLEIVLSIMKECMLYIYAMCIVQGNICFRPMQCVLFGIEKAEEDFVFPSTHALLQKNSVFITTSYALSILVVL